MRFLRGSRVSERLLVSRPYPLRLRVAEQQSMEQLIAILALLALLRVLALLDRQ
jgi:hypothetical protein